MHGIGPKLPLTKDRSDGGYSLIKRFEEEAKQNLKNLILTVPGERAMDPEFGVGLKRFLFEPNVDQTHSAIASRIQRQVAIYMPFVSINDIVFDSPEEDGSVLFVSILFTVVPLGLSEVLDVSTSIK